MSAPSPSEQALEVRLKFAHAAKENYKKLAAKKQDRIIALEAEIQKLREGLNQIKALCPSMVGMGEYWSPEHRHLVKVVGQTADELLNANPKPTKTR